MRQVLTGGGASELPRRRHQPREALIASDSEASGLALVPGSLIRCDVMHYYEPRSGNAISSTGNRFNVTWEGQEYRFAPELPAWKRAFAPSRLARRVLRSDKSNAVPNYRQDGVVVLYDGGVFLFDFEAGTLQRTGTLRNSRNALHGGVAVTEHGIYFGEYGANPKRVPVPVWRSQDDGRSWEVAYTFEAGSIKHIHGVYFDPYTRRLWATTGDFQGECILLSADPDFRDVQVFGDGTQRWRPVSLFFTEDYVIWAMDSPLETCRLQVLDRRTGEISSHQNFPGPVWYTKQLTDGFALLQTTVETGVGVRSSEAHLYVSENLFDWHPIAQFRKDRWPMPLFKFGVIAFADGAQDSNDFIFFGEALEGLDGAAMRASLVRTR